MKILRILQLALTIACAELLLPCGAQEMEQLLQTYRRLPVDDTHNRGELLHLVVDSLSEKNVEVGVAMLKNFWSVEVPHRLQLSRGGEEGGEEFERERRDEASGSGPSEDPTYSVVDLLRPFLPENFTLPPIPEISTRPPFLENITLPPFLENITLPPFLENITLPPFLENITLPPFLENITLPPFLENVTLPPFLEDLSIPTGGFPGGLLGGDASGISTECLQGWATLFNTTNSLGLSDGLQAIDAFGKLGAGYFQGNIYALGSYDECLAIGSTEYCLAEMMMLTQAPINPQIRYGLCLPRECSEDDIARSVDSVNSQLETFGITIALTSVTCEAENKPPYNAGAIIMLIVCSLFIVMVIGGSIVHLGLLFEDRRKKASHKETSRDVERGTTTPESGESRKEKKKTSTMKCLDFVVAFSLFKTVPTILSTKQHSSAITSLNGIRVISMFWVILGHTHLWAFLISDNPLHAMTNVVSRFTYQAVNGGLFAVDSFFVLSGMLVTYLTLRQMARRKGWFRFPVLQYYIHRILRITPTYAFTLFFFWLLTVYLADGPMWQQAVGLDSDIYHNCERYWWTNLLYINNIYPWKMQDECMAWSWYLANDMQFFVVAPLMIIPLFLFYPAGLAVLGLFLVANIATLGGITGGYDLQANMFTDANFDPRANVTEGRNVNDDLYIKPWTRIGPYLIGILLGFLLYKKLKPNFRKPLNYIFYTALWMLAAIFCISTVYGLYDSWRGEEMSMAEDISYQMFSRLTWSLGVALVIYACHNGYGWIVNDFLSLKIWIPLSRLTFVAYLVHEVVLFVMLFTLRVPIHATDITLAVYTVAAVVLSYGVAAVIASFVEFPLSNVEAAVFKLVGFGERESRKRAEEEEVEEGKEVKENLNGVVSLPLEERRKEAVRDGGVEGEGEGVKHEDSVKGGGEGGEEVVRSEVVEGEGVSGDVEGKEEMERQPSDE